MGIEKNKRFYFIYNKDVHKLSDAQLGEEKHEADIYMGIFKRVGDKLNLFERHRVRQIYLEIKKREQF